MINALPSNLEDGQNISNIFRLNIISASINICATILYICDLSSAGIELVHINKEVYHYDQSHS